MTQENIKAEKFIEKLIKNPNTVYKYSYKRKRYDCYISNGFVYVNKQPMTYDSFIYHFPEKK